MTNKAFVTLLITILVLRINLPATAQPLQPGNDKFITYVVDTKRYKIKLYWNDSTGQRFGSIKRLKQSLIEQRQQLRFAMNGGMYKPNHSPVGLYIESGKSLSPLDTTSGFGNFYLKPNGVFYILKNNNAIVCSTEKFVGSNKIKYATQSGPMLLINGSIHSAFTKGSVNKAIRNGVGILPNGSVIFAMSKEPISFYDFANYFKQQGCKNALYLDGTVSRMYLPEKQWMQVDGDFGVMIGVTDLK